MKKRALDLFNRSHQRPGADTAGGGGRIKPGKRPGGRSGGQTAEAKPRIHQKSPRDRWIAARQQPGGRPRLVATSGPLTTISQIDPIKAVVTAGEGPFTDFVSRHPDPEERAHTYGAWSSS